ncbi:Putative dynamitin [Ceraceosorus bombacis]|uniref:Putative dynamitin n=1 Tax=Ceraceosorus bombacis TaxID=401625 RepID=A0A0P1BNR8_9BASI|nr:Putative dynamitin [Ceraceosorus bombacis]
MSSSKYADLPDIDTFSPDVFETSSPDSPSGAAQKIRGVTPSSSSGSESDDPDASFVSATDRPSKRKGGGAGGANALPSSSSLSGLATAKKAGRTEDAGHEAIEAIERSRMNVGEATRCFRQGTGADASGVDFSDQLPSARRKRAQKYPPKSVLEVGYYGQERAGLRSYQSVSPVGSASESRAERLQRLKMESEELERELKEEQDSRGQEWSDSNNASEQERGRERGQGADARMLDQLRQLKGDLNRFDGILSGKRASDSLDAQAWQTQARTLLGQLKEMNLADARGVASVGDTSARIKPHNVGASSELAALESRLHELEQLVGVGALLESSESPPHPLLPTLSRVEHLVTLLAHPRHLDSISRRIKVLVSELERAQEARRKLGFSASISNSGLSLDQRKRLDSLFPVMERIDGLLPLIPAILSRLQTLQDLHSSAGTFAKDLDGLRESQNALGAGETDLRTLLSGVRDSLESNGMRVQGNLQSVAQRLDDLQARVQRLG